MKSFDFIKNVKFCYKLINLNIFHLYIINLSINYTKFKFKLNKQINNYKNVTIKGIRNVIRAYKPKQDS